MRKQRENIRDRILYYLETERIFLKNSLTLTEFSLIVGTNTLLNSCKYNG